MTKVLVLVHTVPPLLSVFDRLCAELLPGVRIFHVLDEPLLERVRRRGALAKEDAARLAAHVAEAAEIGADAVLVTCSTVSPSVDDVRPGAPIPVVKIDEAMMAEAVRLGRRIGVAATNRTTLESTRILLEAQAGRAGKAIETELVLVEGALSALLAGDGETHDRLVKDAVLALARRSDVVVLAQASMARVLVQDPRQGSPATLGAGWAEGLAPILSSPHMALAQVKALLGAESSELS